MTNRTNNEKAIGMRCSRRFQNGVEIIEREVHYAIEAEPSAAVPRLVIVDAISSATVSFIAKTRTEIAGLNALLKSLTHPPIHSK